MQFQTIKNLVFTLFLCSVVSSVKLYAQVTVGSELKPNRAAILDIKDKEAINPLNATDASNVTAENGGLLLPRVLLIDPTTLEPFIPKTDPEWLNNATSKIKEKHVGLQVYNINTIGSTLTPGLHIWDGSQWKKQDNRNTAQEDININYFFYVPSFNIPLGQVGVPTSFELYAQYEKQFTKAGNPTFVSNNPSITKLPIVGSNELYRRDQLDYVLTHYDTNIIESSSIRIDDNGIFTFTTKNTDLTPSSFLNVLFIIKK